MFPGSEDAAEVAIEGAKSPPVALRAGRRGARRAGPCSGAVLGLLEPAGALGGTACSSGTMAVQVTSRTRMLMLDPHSHSRSSAKRLSSGWITPWNGSACHAASV